MKTPKDLGLKIGTPLEVLWAKVKKESEIEIKILEDSLIIQREMLKLAEKRIKEEKEKFK